MRCREVKALLSRYLDKEIGNAELICVTEHLKECADCNKHFMEMEEQDLELAKLSKLSIPEMDEEKVIKYWHTHKARSEKSGYLLYWRYIAVPAIVLFIIVMMKFIQINNEFMYYELSPQEVSRLEYSTPEKQLRYQVGVILTDLRNRVEPVSLYELREKIVKANFLSGIEKVKDSALKNNDYKTYDLFNKVEFFLLNIMNEDNPDFQLADFIQI